MIENAEFDWSALRKRFSNFSNPDLPSRRHMNMDSLVTVLITCCTKLINVKSVIGTITVKLDKSLISVSNLAWVYEDLPSFKIRAGEPTPFAKSGISFVTIDPAPVIDCFPMVTGATSFVSDPMKALSLMVVLCFCLPS